ncbi:MAG: hypothetical protein AAB113_10390 [Candidatus Eisenbacteria bacterium]
MPFLAALLAVSLAVAPPPRSGPTLAVEDTMHTEVPEVLVRAPRVTLDEILDRVARGEARRDSLLHDVAFTATMRIVRGAHGDKGPQLIEETVSRVYKKKPDQVRSVTLRHWEAKPSKKSKVDMNFNSSTEEEVVNFAFRPEARRDFRYRIVGRDLLGDHLVYRIAFEPRSLIGDPAPGGLVWVDTRDFVIIRQELDFSRSPVPLLLKGIDRAVIERQQVDGHWVLRRLLMRAAMTIPMPRFGRSFDIAIQFDDYQVNRGIDDAVFTRGARP